MSFSPFASHCPPGLSWTIKDMSADYIDVLFLLFFVLHALVLMVLLAEREQEVIRSFVDLKIFRGFVFYVLSPFKR